MSEGGGVYEELGYMVGLRSGVRYRESVSVSTACGSYAYTRRPFTPNSCLLELTPEDMRPTSLRLEIEDDDEGAPALTPPAADLQAFCSFAFTVRVGTRHQLAKAARRLRKHFGVDLGVFTNYASSIACEQAGADDLERAWQDAGRVADNAEKALAAIAGGDQQLSGWLEGRPGLAERLPELAARARWAAGQGRRVRLVTFPTHEARVAPEGTFPHP